MEKLNDYLLALSSQHQTADLCKVAMQELKRIIPFDTGYFLIVDQQRNTYNFEILEVTQQAMNEYLSYYEAIDPCRAKTLPTATTMSTNWTALEFKDTEFTIDYARRFDVTHSAGLQLHNAQGSLIGALIMTRSSLRTGFSEREMTYLEIIKPHLDHLYSLMQKLKANPRFAPDLFAGDNLTQREREIAALLCQGLGTDEICAKLFISKQTVYT